MSYKATGCSEKLWQINEALSKYQRLATNIDTTCRIAQEDHYVLVSASQIKIFKRVLQPQIASTVYVDICLCNLLLLNYDLEYDSDRLFIRHST